MGQLEEAQGRLESALARLESASQRIGGSSIAAQVEGELKALRQRCADLENKNQVVRERLDLAIERLSTILDESDGAI